MRRLGLTEQQIAEVVSKVSGIKVSLMRTSSGRGDLVRARTPAAYLVRA